MYGLKKGTSAAVVDGKLPDRLPTLSPDGTVTAPPGFQTTEPPRPASVSGRRR
jgi:hypothetical protein